MISGWITEAIHRGRSYRAANGTIETVGGTCTWNLSSMARDTSSRSGSVYWSSDITEWTYENAWCCTGTGERQYHRICNYLYERVSPFGWGPAGSRRELCQTVVSSRRPTRTVDSCTDVNTIAGHIHICTSTRDPALPLLRLLMNVHIARQCEEKNAYTARTKCTFP